MTDRKWLVRPIHGFEVLREGDRRSAVRPFPKSSDAVDYLIQHGYADRVVVLNDHGKVEYEATSSPTEGASHDDD